MVRRLKIASIREDNNDPCPFGLPIPFGCKYAGKHIENMAPFEMMGKDISEDEEIAISDANTRLLAWNLLRTSEQPIQCPYVGHLIEDKEVVECNYEDSAPGEGAGKAIMPAPFYAQLFNNSLNGLRTTPLGYYSDYNINQNLFNGSFSLMGNWLKKMIEKIG